MPVQHFFQNNEWKHGTPELAANRVSHKYMRGCRPLGSPKQFCGWMFGSTFTATTKLLFLVCVCVLFKGFFIHAGNRFNRHENHHGMRCTATIVRRESSKKSQHALLFENL